MPGFGFWRRWLQLVAMAMCLFGVAMALLNQTAVFSAFNLQVDRVFWPGGSPGAAASQFQGWAYGVWGATVAGFGALVWVMVAYGFRQRQGWVRNGLAACVGLWFLLDTGLSAVYQVWFNVVFNCVILLLVVVPLWMIWPAFDSVEQAATPRAES